MCYKVTMKVKNLIILVFVLGILLGFYSIYLFGVGFHNVDLGQNIQIVNAYGLSITDINSVGQEVTGIELYRLGNSQIRTSFIILGLSLFSIGFSFRELIKK